MAKNLKLNIKNTQLAKALNLDKSKLKKKVLDEKLEEKKLALRAKKPKMLKPSEQPTPTVVPVETPTETPTETSLETAAPKQPKPKTAESKPQVDKPAAQKSTKGSPDKAKKLSFKQLRDIKPRRGGFDGRARAGLTAEDDGRWRKKRIRRKRDPVDAADIIRPTSLSCRLPITVKDLANEMKIKSAEVIGKLFMHGLTLTINDYLEDETTVQLIGQDFGCEITIDTSEEERLQITDQTMEKEIGVSKPEDLQSRPPVIAFMGHVDHGKTSLIDAIRSSNRVAGEAGAITQHIGAFLCETKHGKVTILDTPGHEAFSAMRERGAKITDIIVLVIAGDEGIKDQTIEAIKHAKAAKATIVVAINKSDKEGFNAENVYRQLSENELMPETWGGQTLTVNCSATTKQGMDDLIELLGLQSELLELKGNPKFRARGVVIESQMHKGLGAVATLLVQNGTLKLKDAIVFDQTYGRVKTMHDEHGKHLKVATPSIPVKVTGLSGPPDAGNEFIVVKNEKEAKEIISMRLEKQVRTHMRQKRIIDAVPGEKQVIKICNVTLKADVQGSLEALIDALNKIQSEKVNLHIIQSSIGEISESDVDLARASNATIIGFHTAVEAHAAPMIKMYKVEVELFDVIYHIVDRVKELMKSKLDKLPQENFQGSATIIATFKSSLLGIIAGCSITEGTIRRSDRVRLKREDEIIWEGNFSSLKRVKEDVKEVTKGFECGVVLEGFKDFLIGDTIETYDITYIEQDI